MVSEAGINLVLVSADLESGSSAGGSSGLRSGFEMRHDIGESHFSPCLDIIPLFSERGCLATCTTRDGHDKILYIVKRWFCFILWAVVSVFAAYHTVSVTVFGAAGAVSRSG